MKSPVARGSRATRILFILGTSRKRWTIWILTSKSPPTIQRSRQGYQYYHKFFKTVYRHLMSSVIYYLITTTGNIEQTVAGCLLEFFGCLFWVSTFFIRGYFTPLFLIPSHVTEQLPMSEECLRKCPRQISPSLLSVSEKPLLKSVIIFLVLFTVFPARIHHNHLQT